MKLRNPIGRRKSESETCVPPNAAALNTSILGSTKNGDGEVMCDGEGRAMGVVGWDRAESSRSGDVSFTDQDLHAAWWGTFLRCFWSRFVRIRFGHAQRSKPSMPAIPWLISRGSSEEPVSHRPTTYHYPTPHTQLYTSINSLPIFFPSLPSYLPPTSTPYLH